jgi:tetratricopeptide (TPR) repeat protein
MGGELPQALTDCNQSLTLRPNDPDILDSRGFTYLRLGQLDSAIADFDAALKLNPKLAASLYGRGIAKSRKGDSAGGEDDIAAAKAVKADIAETFAKYGVKPDNALPSGTLDVPVRSPAPNSVTVPVSDCARAETHWKSAEQIATLDVYEDHLVRFPNCDFATLARARIEALKKK